MTAVTGPGENLNGLAKFIAYLKNIARSLDMLVNVICGGRPIETISFRAFKARKRGKAWATLIEWICWPFERDHLAKSSVRFLAAMDVSRDDG